MPTEYISASLEAVANEIGRTQHPACRLRFVPFGRPRAGLPGAGRNRILYADAYLAHWFAGDDRVTLWFDAGGIRYVLAPGRHYLADGSLPDGVTDMAGTLADHDYVLGREDPDGDGYVAVGVGVEVALPE